MDLLAVLIGLILFVILNLFMPWYWALIIVVLLFLVFSGTNNNWRS